MIKNNDNLQQSLSSLLSGAYFRGGLLTKKYDSDKKYTYTTNKFQKWFAKLL